MLPYPKELRIRVVKAVEEGMHTIPEVAELFGVGVAFVKKMLRLSRSGEDLSPRHGGGARPILGEKELELLRTYIDEKPDATLEEAQNELEKKCKVKASAPTISRALQQLNLPRKKRPSLLKKGMKKSARRFVK